MWLHISSLVLQVLSDLLWPGWSARGDKVVGFDNFSTGKRENISDVENELELHEADLHDGTLKLLVAAQDAKGKRVIIIANAGDSLEPGGSRAVRLFPADV